MPGPVRRVRDQIVLVLSDESAEQLHMLLTYTIERFYEGLMDSDTPSHRLEDYKDRFDSLMRLRQQVEEAKMDSLDLL